MNGDAPGVHPGEISALLAWARRLTAAGPHAATPAEHAAYLDAKANLLERIATSHDGESTSQETAHAHHVADAARAAANHAAAVTKDKP